MKFSNSIKLLLIAMLIALPTSLPTSAQTKRQPKKTDVGSKKSAKKSVPNLMTNEFQSGEVRVDVRSAADRIIRLGLAPGGVTLVEFPADDYVFARHPGDEDFITIDEQIKARGRPTDPLIFRPGKNFYLLDDIKAKTPYGQITVQMISGAVFTFQIYPVKELSRSATRVYVLYNPQAVINERQRLGLPVYLNRREFTDSVAEQKPDKKSDEISTEKKEQISESGEVKTGDKPNLPALVSPTSSEAQAAADEKLAEASLPKRKWDFKKAVHGLSLAMQPPVLTTDGKLRILLVAVKNKSREPLRLVNLPELVVETWEEKKSLNRETVALKAVAQNLPADGLLQPSKIHFFALAIEPPILGAKQTLRVSVAQTNAADEPALIDVLLAGR